MHGGQVEASSPAGERGSEFVIRLAALAPVRTAPAARRAAPRGAMASRRIVVVDDNIDAAESLALLLQHDGHEVHVAHDGHAALDAARGFRPDIVLSDFTLPGFGTLRREGIELTTGFTATVNADMKVGSLEETLTVSGAAPLVDTQNVNQQRVFSRTITEQLPSSPTINQYATMIPAKNNTDIAANTAQPCFCEPVMRPSV